MGGVEVIKQVQENHIYKEGKPMIIKTDITDWNEEYVAIEPKLQNREDLLELIKDPNFGPSQIGRMAIVARERKEAPNDIISPNKALLNAGASHEVSAYAVQQVTTVKLQNGNEVEIRELVANVKDEDGLPISSDDEEMEPIDFSFAESISDEGLKRAKQYLQKRVPGYISNRLSIIAANSGDVEGEAEKLKEAIDGIVKRLV